MATHQVITIEAWTPCFLGSATFGERLLSWIQAVDGGRWTPQRWSFYEPIRTEFKPANVQEILQSWSQPAESGTTSRTLYLTRRKPNALVMAYSWRSPKRPYLNWVMFDLSAGEFGDVHGRDRAIRILTDLVDISQAVYATARHSSQSLKRIVPGTPLERLEQINWLNWFGKPYVDLFGGARHVLDAPAVLTRRVHGGALVVASNDPVNDSIDASMSQYLSIEEHLGRAAFAGYGYPEIRCLTPTIDLSDVIAPGSHQLNARTRQRRLPNFSRKIEHVVDSLLAAAEGQLTGGPHLQPFGAVERRDKTIELVLAASDQDDVVMLSEALRSRLKDEAVVTAGLCYERRPVGQERLAALQVVAEHRDGTRFDGAFPINRSGGRVEFGQVISIASDHTLFRRQGMSPHERSFGALRAEVEEMSIMKASESQIISRLMLEQAKSLDDLTRRAVEKAGGLVVYSDLGGMLVLRPDLVVMHYDFERGTVGGPETGKWMIVALVAAAEKYPELHGLVPSRSATNPTCTVCSGSGRVPPGVYCGTCGGLGWI